MGRVCGNTWSQERKTASCSGNKFWKFCIFVLCFSNSSKPFSFLFIPIFQTLRKCFEIWSKMKENAWPATTKLSIFYGLLFSSYQAQDKLPNISELEAFVESAVVEDEHKCTKSVQHFTWAEKRMIVEWRSYLRSIWTLSQITGQLIHHSQFGWISWAFRCR